MFFLKVFFFSILIISNYTLSLQKLNQKEKIKYNGEEYVDFENSCKKELKEEINSAVAAFHSFEYEISTKKFENITKEDNECAIAYWGLSISLHYPLWFPPSRVYLIFFKPSQH
jgi:hypothetical protein